MWAALAKAFWLFVTVVAPPALAGFLAAAAEAQVPAPRFVVTGWLEVLPVAVGSAAPLRLGSVAVGPAGLLEHSVQPGCRVGSSAGLPKGNTPELSPAVA